MNTHQWYMMGLRSIQTPNTFIGGVSATISTAALLATKLGILESRITNFSVVGSDIQCRITGSYSIPSDAFLSSTVTYYKDNDGLVTSMGSGVFYLSQLSGDILFQNATSIGSSVFRVTRSKIYILPNLTSITGGDCFRDCFYSEKIYIPLCTNLGGTVGYDSTFFQMKTGTVIYCHPSLATNNGGAPDGDIASAISAGMIIRYVTNTTAPNPITDLSIGTVYNTALQLNFTAPTGSTNAIEFYDCYANGEYKNTITGSGQHITGLTPGTSYTITVKPIDILYNQSSSNAVTQVTNNVADTFYATDADATTYLTNAGISSTAEVDSTNYLFYQLKNKSLFWSTQSIHLFKGTTAAQHKLNAKNPLDTNAAFRLTFTGTAGFSNLGYLLNGSSYANTYFIPSAQQNVNSNGVTVVCGTNDAAFTTDCVEYGAYNGSSQNSILQLKANNSDYRKITGMNGTYLNYSGVNESRGIFTTTKQSATVTKLFRNNALLVSGNSGGALPTIACYIGAANVGGSAYKPTGQRLQMVINHPGYSDAEIAILHAIIDYSESLAGRKTW